MQEKDDRPTKQTSLNFFRWLCENESALTLRGHFLHFLRNGVNFHLFGMWLSLVERSVRDAEAGGSNPLIPTSKFKGLRA